MMKTYLDKKQRNNISTVIPADYVNMIRHRLKNEDMTDLKSFHIADNANEVICSHDEIQKQLPRVIYL